MTLEAPKTEEILEATEKSQDVLAFLARRRSTLARAMTGPGPDQDQLDLILRIAARVPDHRKLAPWRFILFQDAARTEIGSHLAARFQDLNPEMDAERIQFESERFKRAPVVVAVVSSPKDCPRGTPKWEQELSSGAVCLNLLLAARASGFAAQWLTEWYAFDSQIAKSLGLTENERISGFMYIGTATEHPKERARPDISELVSSYDASAQFKIRAF